MQRIWKILKDESAGAMVENVLVLPLVFMIVMYMIISAFMMHDRATIESAAKRGAIYAANCISNPNYASIVGQSGELDVAENVSTNFQFSSVGQKLKARYRAFTGGINVSGVVTQQVTKIVDNTRIPWLPQESVKVECHQKNMFLYQDVEVVVKAKYDVPGWFAIFGLDTEFEYKASAKTRTTDPDEFIRNADLIVDIITDIDNATGGKLGKATDKITELASKVIKWLGDDEKKG
jgi:hypothetical protein